MLKVLKNEIKPYNHQENACKFALELFSDKAPHKGCALLMEMGTGKTLSSIMIAGNLFMQNKIHKVLIVAPLSVVDVWKNEFDKFAGFQYDFTVLKGTSAREKKKVLETATAKFDAYPEHLSVIAINYESAWRMEKDLLGYDADLIIADEGHKIKEGRTSQSKSMHTLGDKARYKLLLTGTPITNRELDIYSEYRYCDSRVFGTNFFIFRNRYFYLGYFKEPIFKKETLPDFTNKVHSIAYRVTKAECIDLPEIIEEERLIDLEPKAYELYKQIEDECYAELNGGEITASNVLTKILRLAEITGGYIPVSKEKNALMTKVSDAKMNALKEIITSCIAENQKVVIMTRFTSEMDEMEEWLNISNIHYSKIRGGVKDRDTEIKNFQENDDCKVFIGQIQTAGTGITLTAAHIMVFYSLDYNMSNFDQAKARIHRPGQKEKCQYIYLIGRHTIDGKVVKALRHKVDIAKLIIDEARNGINPFNEEK